MASTLGVGCVVIVLFVVIAVAGVAGVAFLRFQARRSSRVRAVMALAPRIGFTFSVADVEHLVDMPFALFSKGDGRRIELVISGVHNDVPMRMRSLPSQCRSPSTTGSCTCEI